MFASVQSVSHILSSFNNSVKQVSIDFTVQIESWTWPKVAFSSGHYQASEARFELVASCYITWDSCPLLHQLSWPHKCHVLGVKTGVGLCKISNTLKCLYKNCCYVYILNRTVPEPLASKESSNPPGQVTGRLKIFLSWSLVLNQRGWKVADVWANTLPMLRQENAHMFTFAAPSGYWPSHLHPETPLNSCHDVSALAAQLPSDPRVIPKSKI